MNNKVLIKLIVLELNTSFDVFIPVNEVVWKIKQLLIKSINEMTNVPLNTDVNYILLNKINSRIYSNNEILINTDVRNGSELLLISSN